MAWTKKATDKLLEMYKEGSTVQELAEEFVRNKTSIINKLVKEGVYNKPEKPAVFTKKMMVRAVREVTELDLPSMEKMDKAEILLLVKWLQKDCKDCTRKIWSPEQRDSFIARLLRGK